MQRVPNNDRLVYFTPDEVEAMVRAKLREEGETRSLAAFQIKVEHPFGGGMTVHNEIPQFTIMLESK